MKIAICNETFRDWSHERAFAYAAELGYDGIEIAPFTLADSAFDIDDHGTDAIVQIAQNNGLHVVGLHWLLAGTKGLHLTSPDKAVRMATAEYLIRLAEVSAALGGQVLVFGSPAQRQRLPGVSQEAALAYAAECIEMALPTLESVGAVLALEPLGPEEGNFLNTAAETMTLIRRLDSPHVRLHLDVKAMATESLPPQQIIAEHSSCLAHFHCNDPNRRGPGMGDTDFRPILQALRDAEYQGWLSVEVFDTTVTPEQLAGDSIRYLRSLI